MDLGLALNPSAKLIQGRIALYDGIGKEVARHVGELIQAGLTEVASVNDIQQENL